LLRLLSGDWKLSVDLTEPRSRGYFQEAAFKKALSGGYFQEATFRRLLSGGYFQEATFRRLLPRGLPPNVHFQLLQRSSIVC